MSEKVADILVEWQGQVFDSSEETGLAQICASPVLCIFKNCFCINAEFCA